MANKMPTHYEVLGVSNTATQDEIAKAYYSLVRKYNPVVIRREMALYRKTKRSNGESPLQSVLDNFEDRIVKATESLEQVMAAYEVLNDVESRELYDDVLEVEAEEESDAIVVLFDPSFIDFGHVKPVPGETLTATVTAILLTGDVSKKRLNFEVPSWMKFDFEAPNGTFPLAITLSIDSDDLVDGVYKGKFVLVVGDLKFDLDVSLVISRKVNVATKQPTMVVVPPPPIPVINIPVPAAPPAPTFNRTAFRSRWVPILVGIGILFYVLPALMNREPPNPFTDFCSRPVVASVVGLHVNIIDNGLFMYGKLKGTFQVNDKTYEVDAIPKDLVVTEFPERVTLLDVTVTSGPHEGEKSSCNKELYTK